MQDLAEKNQKKICIYICIYQKKAVTLPRIFMDTH